MWARHLYSTILLQLELIESASWFFNKITLTDIQQIILLHWIQYFLKFSRITFRKMFTYNAFFSVRWRSYRFIEYSGSMQIWILAPKIKCMIFNSRNVTLLLKTWLLRKKSKCPLFIWHVVSNPIPKITVYKRTVSTVNVKYAMNRTRN